jgi:hypothetical protein
MLLTGDVIAVRGSTSRIFELPVRAAETPGIICRVVNRFLATKSVGQAEVAGLTTLSVSTIIQSCMIAWNSLR